MARGTIACCRHGMRRHGRGGRGTMRATRAQPRTSGVSPLAVYSSTAAPRAISSSSTALAAPAPSAWVSPTITVWAGVKPLSSTADGSARASRRASHRSTRPVCEASMRAVRPFCTLASTGGDDRSSSARSPAPHAFGVVGAAARRTASANAWNPGENRSVGPGSTVSSAGAAFRACRTPASDWSTLT